MSGQQRDQVEASTVLILRGDGGYRVEVFDAQGDGLLPFPSPAFATLREAELHAVAELARLGIDPAQIVIDWPAE